MQQFSPPRKNCHGVRLARKPKHFCGGENCCHGDRLGTQGVGSTSEHDHSLGRIANFMVKGPNMGEKKYFVLMKGGKDTSQVFASRQPRGAALKAATRGHTDIRLRERGTKRVHVFTGRIETVDKPANGPAWLPDKIKKANVSKTGIEHL